MKTWKRCSNCEFRDEMPIAQTYCPQCGKPTLEPAASSAEIRQANRDAHEEDYPEDARARTFDGGF